MALKYDELMQAGSKNIAASYGDREKIGRASGRERVLMPV